MTLKIKLSSLTIAPDEFAKQVKAYAAAMKEYAGHLEGVKADAENETLAPSERRVAFPPPEAEPLVMRAAAEGYECEGPTLDEKKAALFAEVRRMETEALHSVIPPAKARHWQFVEQDIRAAHAKAVAVFYESHKGAHFEQNELPKMNDADAATVVECEARQAKQQQISRRAARLEHDIDDLTDETVDGFVLEPL